MFEGAVTDASRDGMALTAAAHLPRAPPLLLPRIDCSVRRPASLLGCQTCCLLQVPCINGAAAAAIPCMWCTRCPFSDAAAQLSPPAAVLALLCRPRGGWASAPTCTSRPRSAIYPRAATKCLRQIMKWHGGKPVTASDMAAAATRLGGACQPTQMRRLQGPSRALVLQRNRVDRAPGIAGDELAALVMLGRAPFNSAGSPTRCRCRC